MTFTVTVSQTHLVEAVCDQCGTTRRWSQETDPKSVGTPLDLGFDMRDPRWNYEPRTLWFCQSDCVHRWVDDHVINYLRIAAEAQTA